jgi:hypothetical protein
MTVNRYILTSTVVVPTGTAAALTAGEPGTGGAAGYSNAATTGGPLWGTTFAKGQAIMLDPAGPLFSQIGAGNLRAWVDGTDNVGHGGGLSN